MQQNQLVFNDQYLLKRKISSGSFGTVYTTLDLQSRTHLAIKLEEYKGENDLRSVLREGQFLKRLEGIPGISKVYWSGTEHNYDCLVQDLLGEDLASKLKQCKKFSLKTVTMIADQSLTLLERIHNRGIVHRDLKPENMVMGRNETSQTLYLIDFGISKQFKDSKNIHIQFREQKPFIGTTRYASIASHRGFEIGRKDDLESLGYLLLYLIKGQLPWQNLNVPDKEKQKRAGEIKMKIDLAELTGGLPRQIRIQTKAKLSPFKRFISQNSIKIQIFF